MRAWWYGPDTLPHGDGRKVTPGCTLTVKGEIVLCERGLHSSIRSLDALQYGHGHFWRVQPGGTIVHGDNKLASSERTHLWRVKDTDGVLRHFARLCALDVIHLWDAPRVVVQYLKTGDEELRCAARDAVMDAVMDAAKDAVMDAVMDAVRAVDWAAGAAAWNAAEVAVWNAVWNAAWNAARAAQNKRLHRMLMEAERVEAYEKEKG